MKSKKIAVLTLNPGIDRVIYLGKPMIAGGHNRSLRTVVNQGSKGANQAVMLKNLGVETHYFSFTGGSNGKLAESFLAEMGIRSHYVETKCGVRVNIKVIEPDGRGTEFNECGGPVAEDELKHLTDDLLGGGFDIISLCGSFPQGVENSVYNSLITAAKQTGATVILDTAKESLALGVKAEPYLIKPNREELTALGFESPENKTQALSACGKICEKHGCGVICTLDSDGSVYCGRDGAYMISVKPQNVKGFSGAGDSYLAAFIYKKLIEEADTCEALRFGAAASCAKVCLEGTLMPTREQTEAALGEITVEKIM